MFRLKLFNAQTTNNQTKSNLYGCCYLFCKTHHSIKAIKKIICIVENRRIHDAIMVCYYDGLINDFICNLKWSL